MRQTFLARALPAVGLAAAATAVACGDPLTVANKNNPDVERAFASAVGVETVVSKLFQQIHQGAHGTQTSLVPGAMSMSFESSSQLGNYCMGTRGALPRSPIGNARGNGCAEENFRVFDHLMRNGRSAANAVKSLADFTAAGVSLGSAARDARALSVAWFNLGVAMGEVALFYDSAAVLDPAKPAAEAAPLVGYAAVMTAALAALDSSLSYATGSAATNGANGWPIPNTWIPTPAGNGITLDSWRQIVRSFRARFRANVGRTPAEHNAANWDLILADATNGVTEDFSVQMTSSNGWSQPWWNQARTSTGWHQMPNYIIGMADTTGVYNTWLATLRDQREPFLIRTPDKRFPSGDTRAVQQAVTGTVKAPPSTGRIFFRNRPTGEDTPSFAWGTSFYDHVRFWYYGAASNNGPNPIVLAAEVDMLAAEAHIRKGQVAPAVALVDKWRTMNGLPATGVTSLTQPVAGGSACVPRVPTGPNFTTTSCGNLLEAMKWEKRMETAFAAVAQWYLDSRGWGDLAEGTPLDYPVPYQEMDARGKAFYDSQRQAPKGTYGF